VWEARVVGPAAYRLPNDGIALGEGALAGFVERALALGHAAGRSAAAVAGLAEHAV
jgi:hypothetical protein